MFPLSILRGNNGEPKQCASGTSCGAQAGAVTCGEVRSSDFSDRVIKRFRNSQTGKPTDANYIGSFTAQDGAGTKGTMGACSEGIAASSCDCENDGLGSCEARHVSISPQENRGGTAGEVGKGEGPANEGGIGQPPPRRAASLTTRSMRVTAC